MRNGRSFTAARLERLAVRDSRELQLRQSNGVRGISPERGLLRARSRHILRRLGMSY